MIKMIIIIIIIIMIFYCDQKQTEIATKVKGELQELLTKGKVRQYQVKILWLGLRVRVGV
jgi:hypothetical protein